MTPDNNKPLDDTSAIDDASRFLDNQPDPVIIKAIGVGGGGGNAVDHMYSQGIANVSFANINTDMQDLKNTKVPTKIVIGDGFGAGNDAEVARKAAEESADAISKLFDDDTKMVFITAGMGGGTGTGAAPVVARIAKERGLLTIGIVTIPFLFEGRKKIMKALDAADEMSKNVDALMVINNERLTEIYGDYSFLNAFAKADDTLTIAARSISELITTEGKVNLDFKDVNATLRDGGAAIISTGYGEGENRVSKAIEDALHSPLLKNRDVMGSKKLLFNLYFSPEAENEFKMDETHELTDFINSIDPGVDVIWGVGEDRTLGDTVKITILAAGFEVSLPDDTNIERPGGNRNTFGGNRNTDPKQGSRSTGGTTPHSFNRPGNPTPAETAPQTRTPDERETRRRIEEEYGSEKVINMEGSRQRYIILSPNQFDDDSIIEILETQPTYNRDKKVVERIRGNATSASQRSDYSNPQGQNQINFL